jgi:hypothetical protein
MKRRSLIFQARLWLRFGLQLLIVIGLATSIFSITPAWKVRYLPFDQVRDLIEEMVSSGAPDVPAEEIKDAAAWDQWIHARDRTIRGRIDRGVEDSISNLILFGTSYSQLPPIQGFAKGADSNGALTPAARERIHALVQALRQPGENERVRFARDFLARRQVGADSQEGYLAGNLQRLIGEESAYDNNLQSTGKTGDAEAVYLGRATIYKQRGLSFDTSLEPDFALDTMLKQLTQKGIIAPGSVRRIAVIGPGLDFADKRLGLDFYPIQTLQPFAVLETVLRLGLGQTDKVRVVACDLNPAVLNHIQRMAAQAAQGRPYVVQLPNDSRNGWSSELVSYWRHFGAIVGSPTRPIAAPGYFQGVEVRAVAIRPQFAARMTGQDLDMVAQQLDVPPGGGFDLVVATNVFMYYNFFEQALAMQNITRMMNPRGVFIVNQILSNQHPDSLKLVDQCNVSFSSKELYGDDVVAYQQQ